MIEAGEHMKVISERLGTPVSEQQWTSMAMLVKKPSVLPSHGSVNCSAQIGKTPDLGVWAPIGRQLSKTMGSEQYTLCS
jgi:hypothetical protein